APSGRVSSSRISVVLPAPRKPVTTVTGMRAPRGRRCRRPNGLASLPAKGSDICRQLVQRKNACNLSLRPSRRARRALLRMRSVVDGIKKEPHPERERSEQSKDAFTLIQFTPVDLYYRVHRSGDRAAETWVPAFAGTTSLGTSEIHFQCIEAASMAVDGVDDGAVIDEDVVDLAGASRRIRHLRHEIGDFFRLI